MTTPPTNPKIYHITHIDNLPKIIADGCLRSDRARITEDFECKVIGMPAIKQRRLTQITVSCHPGTFVGDYVPFYLCPRSEMLFIFYRNNHADLPYRGGQEPIVHLQANMNACIDWARQHGVRFAFSDRNAGSRTADFFSETAELNKINWTAVNSNDFSDRFIGEQKQAEFLVFGSFPWSLVEHIGVFDKNRRIKALQAVSSHSHQPSVRIEKDWYF